MWFLLFLCFVRRSCCSDPARGSRAQPDLRKKRSQWILPWSRTVYWWKVRARRLIFNFCWLLTELDEKCTLFQEDITKRRGGKKRENHRHTHTHTLSPCVLSLANASSWLMQPSNLTATKHKWSRSPTPFAGGEHTITTMKIGAVWLRHHFLQTR